MVISPHMNTFGLVKPLPYFKVLVTSGLLSPFVTLWNVKFWQVINKKTVPKGYSHFKGYSILSSNFSSYIYYLIKGSKCK